MINKEEIEKIEKLKKIIKEWREWTEERFKGRFWNRNETREIDISVYDMEFLVCLLEKQENRIKELEEINKEHQKVNGELQKKLTYYEDICKGKSIQELGVSDLYKED